MLADAGVTPLKPRKSRNKRTGGCQILTTTGNDFRVSDVHAEGIFHSGSGGGYSPASSASN